MQGRFSILGASNPRRKLCSCNWYQEDHDSCTQAGDIGAHAWCVLESLQAWCWQDEWFGLTVEDIRRMEAETQVRTSLFLFLLVWMLTRPNSRKWWAKLPQMILAVLWSSISKNLHCYPPKVAFWFLRFHLSAIGRRGSLVAKTAIENESDLSEACL